MAPEIACEQFIDELIHGKPFSASLLAHLASCPSCAAQSSALDEIRTAGSAFVGESFEPLIQKVLTKSIPAAPRATSSPPSAAVSSGVIGGIVTGFVVGAIVGGMALHSWTTGRSQAPSAAGSETPRIVAPAIVSPVATTTASTIPSPRIATSQQLSGHHPESHSTPTAVIPGVSSHEGVLSPDQESTDPQGSTGTSSPK